MLTPETPFPSIAVGSLVLYSARHLMMRSRTGESVETRMNNNTPYPYTRCCQLRADFLLAHSLSLSESWSGALERFVKCQAGPPALPSRRTRYRGDAGEECVAEMFARFPPAGAKAQKTCMKYSGVNRLASRTLGAIISYRSKRCRVPHGVAAPRHRLSAPGGRGALAPSNLSSWQPRL